MSNNNHRPKISESIPHIILGLVSRGSEIILCLRSKCDTRILKVEKVMMHLAFILGFASPSRLVYVILRNLVTGALTGIGTFLDDHPYVEKTIRVILPMFEQVVLGSVWDYVRDSVICMRFNNCDGDFFGQLNNIKLSVCEVDDPFDEDRRISTCEQLFNDSPLIALSIAMLILGMMASLQLDIVDPPPPPPAPAQ